MTVGTFGALVLMPSLFEISSISQGMASYLAIGGAMTFLLILLIEVLRLNVEESGKKSRR